MRPAGGQTRGARSFWVIIAAAVVITGLIGGIYSRQQAEVKERERPAPETIEAPAETSREVTTAPVPVEIGSEASAVPAQALFLLFPHGREEFHFFNGPVPGDYLLIMIDDKGGIGEKFDYIQKVRNSFASLR